MKSISKINLTLLALSMSFMGFAQALSEREGLDIYQRGLYLEAIEYWKKAAAAGDAGSAYRLSEEYFDAKIVKRDLKLALKYLRQASEGNDAMLRDQLSYKTKRAKSDRRPGGSYVDIKYPGYERDMMNAMGGWAPKGHTTYHESTDDFEARRKKQREWAMQQRKMVGDSFVPDGSAVDAMWNRIHNGRRF